MKLLTFLLIWFIASIPIAILIGNFIAAGNGIAADTVSCLKKECHNLSKNETQGDISLKDAA